ncbi:MAG TPA: winged helix-turn-helix transcriptional regulator [Sphingomonas sp.]|jgi:DNA-binding HxlR family transcriptional regulator/putative sterol carrier protein|nr:winged helix-turn-helix transcriptional regulator [Sphingomonas sp.]
MKLENVTKRWYDDACGTALALELVGERWALLVVRELMYGPRRFGEIKANLAGISANVLTQRLDGLARAGIVVRRKLPPPASVQVYELTPWGAESEPIFQEMGRWATRSPAHDPMLPLSPASAMMSLRTMIAARRGDLAMTIAFRFATDSFVAHLTPQELAIARGDTDDAELVFACDPTTLVRIFYGKWPVVEAEAAGMLRFSGDRTRADAFIGLFALPAKIVPVHGDG